PPLPARQASMRLLSRRMSSSGRSGLIGAPTTSRAPRAVSTKALRRRSRARPAVLVKGKAMTRDYVMPPGSLQGPPQIPARHRAMGPALLAVLLQRLRRGQLSFAERFGIGLAQAVVAERQHVWPAEAEHQEHLGRPAADAMHGDEVLYDLLVRHPA